MSLNALPGPTPARFVEWRDTSVHDDYHWWVEDRQTGETAYLRGNRCSSGEAGREWKEQQIKDSRS